MLNLPIKILRTIEIEAARATIEFDNIAELVAQWDTVAHVTSRHLVLIVNAASPDAVAKRAVEITINADAGANYNHQTLTGENAAADADRQDGVNALFELVGTDYPFAIPGTTYADAFGGGTILFPHAFNTVNHKVALALGGAVEDYVSAVVGRWASVAAITSLIASLDTGNFASGSTIHLGVIGERYLVEEWESAGVGTAIFDNIPQGEGDLVVVGYAKSTQDAVADEVLHYINDDGVAANYPAQELLAIGAGPPVAASPINGECAQIPGQQGANVFGALVISYSQYIKDNQPHFLSTSGYHSSVGPAAEVRLMSGRRDNIEPINKIELDPTLGVNFSDGSLLSLYRVPKRIIERIELTEDTPTITFDNIPQNFEDLILHVYVRSSEADNDDLVQITLNGDAVAANYDMQVLEARGAVATAASSNSSMGLMYIPADNEGAGEYAGGAVLFPGYAESDRHKHLINFSGNNENQQWLRSQRWESMAAITSIALSLATGPNFLAGSVFELEGIMRREGLPPDEGMRV